MTSEVLSCINKCYLKELTKNYDESENNVEYDIRRSTLKKHFEELRKTLSSCQANILEKPNIDIVASLLILQKELQTEGPWNLTEFKALSSTLNRDFEILYEIPLDSVMNDNEMFEENEVFNACLQKLHLKLNAKTFKKYPSLINVYCKILQEISSFKVNINPMKTLPASLLLIDDYSKENKIKGLHSCACVLRCLTIKNFESGNYYEVVYAIIFKLMATEKDVQVTRIMLECLNEILRILPVNEKNVKMDELFPKALDEVLMETNIFRKVHLLNFILKLMNELKSDCIRWKKKCMLLLIDNIKQCAQGNVNLLELTISILEVLETWLKYCWCIWKFTSDQKLLSFLLMLLYTIQDCSLIQRTQKIIIQLIKLSTKDDREMILKSISETSIDNKEYLIRLETIKNNV